MSGVGTKRPRQNCFLVHHKTCTMLREHSLFCSPGFSRGSVSLAVENYPSIVGHTEAHSRVPEIAKARRSHVNSRDNQVVVSDISLRQAVVFDRCCVAVNQLGKSSRSPRVRNNFLIGRVPVLVVSKRTLWNSLTSTRPHPKPSVTFLHIIPSRAFVMAAPVSLINL